MRDRDDVIAVVVPTYSIKVPVTAAGYFFGIFETSANIQARVISSLNGSQVLGGMAAQPSEVLSVS